MFVNRIKETAQQELNGADEQFLDQLWNKINTVFQKWKLEHGDRNPKMVDTQLDFRRPIRSPYPIPFEDAEPWECAGLEAPSPIGLTLKLSKEKYPEFMKIIKGKDACKTLALLITKTPTPIKGFPKYYYAIRVNDFYDASELLKILSDNRSRREGAKAALNFNQDKIKAGEKLQESLSMGNPVAAKKKAERAKEYQDLWITWAKETWEAHPYWEVTRVADHVLKIANDNKHKMANGNAYKVGTIIKVITGVKQSLKSEN